MLSTGQRYKYFALFGKAWLVHCTATDENPNNKAAEANWRHQTNLDATGSYSIKEMNQTDDFDHVMLELAIIAEDTYWIDRLSSTAERRIKWVIEKQFIPDLEFLKKEAVTWDYIKAICEKAGFPTDFNDCPAQLLVRVLQMVDTHIRRMAKKQGIDLIDLPSGYFRRGIRPADRAQAKFRHDHHHHVTHNPVGAVGDRAKGVAV